MRPELFIIPGLNLSIKSYGTMMVLGFVAAMLLARWRSRRLGVNAAAITDFAVWVLVAGIVGARAMFVLHELDYFRAHPEKIPAVWSGGLEFLGGLIAASLVTVVYLRWKKLPVLKTLDILAPAAMLGLAFGRIGCFLNGCCFGQVSELPWAIEFPALVTDHAGEVDQRYSYAYRYQLEPDEDRAHPLLKLPEGYYVGYTDGQGHWVDSPEELRPEERGRYYAAPKEPGELTVEQLSALKAGEYPMLGVHPTQLYSSATALVLAGVLTGLFRWYRFEGQIIGAMLVLYGLARFGLELLRTEPYAVGPLTISQALGLGGAAAGAVLLLWRWWRTRASGQASKAGHEKGV